MDIKDLIKIEVDKDKLLYQEHKELVNQMDIVVKRLKEIVKLRADIEKTIKFYEKKINKKC